MPQGAAGFERQYRLLSSAQFREVLGQRQSVHGKFFSIHVAGNSLSHARMGLTVSRKVSKRAVQRNRIKRQVRESFRLNRGDLEELDFVVVAKPGCAGRDGRELRDELDRLWFRAVRKCRKF